MAARFAKALALACCAVPLLWLAAQAVSDGLGANPIEALIRTLGDWSLRMLLVALAVTPLRQATGWGWVGRLRRLLGLMAFAYVGLHVLAYAGLDQVFDWPAIGREIVKRRYIAVGMAALLILSALAATSADGMVRRLGGRRWRNLHRLVYLAAPLGVLHHLMMVKADIRPALLHAAVLAVLLGWRLLRRKPGRSAELAHG